MRILVAIAFTVLGLGMASAADIDRGQAGPVPPAAPPDDGPLGQIAGQVIVYDFEPGVVVRAYWLPPWRNQHYFPFGSGIRTKPPKHARYVKPRPAPSYHAYWSSSSVIDPQPQIFPVPVVPSYEQAPYQDPYGPSRRRRRR